MDSKQTDRLLPAPKEPFELEIENMALQVQEGADVASGWTPWFAEDNRFQVPKFFAIPLGKAKRVQGIAASVRHDAGLWQHAQTRPGFAITVTMHFQVVPDGDTDHKRPDGMVVGVGIDPSGNTDPRGDSVQWALRDLDYRKVVTATVTAVAQKEHITVFVRSIAFLPGSTTAAGNGTAQACSYNCARTRYDRTYLLLPPSADEELWKEAAKAAFVRKWTLGASADDAGIGSDLLTRRWIIAVDPKEWSKTDPPDEDWYIEHYPPGYNITYSAITK